MGSHSLNDGASIFGACMDVGCKKPHHHPIVPAGCKAQLPSQLVLQLEPDNFPLCLFQRDFSRDSPCAREEARMARWQMPHWRELSATKKPGRALAAAARECSQGWGTAGPGGPWVRRAQSGQLGDGLQHLGARSGQDVLCRCGLKGADCTRICPAQGSLSRVSLEGAENGPAVFPCR